MDARVNGREKGIIELISEQGQVSVSELSQLFGVSEITIRRDLDRLSGKKIVKRFHGGARKLTPERQEAAVTEFSIKENERREEKERIGLKACEYVGDYDTVFMNSGTTVLRFLQNLDRKGVTVVTNNTAALEQPVRADITLLMLGGVYNERTRALGGELTSGNLKAIYSDCTILGVNALDLKEGMTTSVYQECMTNNAMIDHSRGKVILLADHSKMGRISSYVSSPLSKISTIITDSQCPESYISGFQELGIEVVIV